MTQLSNVEVLDDEFVDEALDRVGTRFIVTIGCRGRKEGK
jgi:hypothetical protein